MTNIFINETYSNVVYYNDNHSKTQTCTDAVSNEIQVTWTCPSTWRELCTELENGCKFLAFHVDMIAKSIHATAIEFIDAIKVMIKFIPQSVDLRIGVIIKPDTPVSAIRDLQKSGVQGILLDLNYYPVEAVGAAVNALVNKIPYWPKHIIDQLPGNTKKLISTNSIDLTARQQQVFQLITERGASNKVIAKALGVSESAVKLHITKIFKKYGVRNRTQLAVFSNAT